MRRGGLEWVFRLAQEPRRLFGRYAKDLWVFGWSISRQWLSLRGLRSKGGNSDSSSRSPVKQDPVGSHQYVRFEGSLNLAGAGHAVAVIESILTDGRPCILDLSHLGAFDSTGIAFLMRLKQRLHAAETALVLLGVQPALRRNLIRMHLDGFFDDALSLATALQLLQIRGQERGAFVDQVSLPSSRMAWRGEITAANAPEVWMATQTFLNSGLASLYTTSVRTTTLAGSPGSDRRVLVDVDSPPLPSPVELVIDLSQVRFIDSSGLGLMVRARKFAQRQGIDLAFTGLQPAVCSVVRLARLEEFLKVRPNRPAQSLEVSFSPTPA